MEKFIISKEYLHKVLTNNARSLVGISMKRFELFLDSTKSKQEIFKDIESVKKCIKELIYEHYRDLEAKIASFSYGVKFISPNQDKPE